MIHKAVTSVMRRVRCRECGEVNEVPDEGDLPRCEFCEQSLRTGTVLTWLEDGEVAAEEPATTVADNRSFPCECGASGGPKPSDPSICFRCGGVLPTARSSPDIETERLGDGNPSSSSTEASPLAWVLRLADGRWRRIGDGILIVRGDPDSNTDMRMVALSTKYVSRKHAWLRAVGRSVEVLDLASRNGTWIDGGRIEPLQPTLVPDSDDVPIWFSRREHALLVVDRRGSAEQAGGTGQT